MKQQIESVLEAIKVLVNNDDAPWVEKRRALLKACDSEDATALGEFVSWFDGLELRFDGGIAS